MATERTDRPRIRTGPAAIAEARQHLATTTGKGAGASSAARRGGSIAHWLLLIMGPFILLSVIAATVVYVRLLHGPVSLQSFAPRIEAGITAELETLKAQIDDAVLVLTEDRGVELRLVNLQLKEAGGDLVASAPLAAVTLNSAALWRFSVAPERVFLIEPKLSLSYTEQGGLVMRFDPAQAPTTQAPPADASPGPPKPEGSTAVSKGEHGASDADSGAAPAFHQINLARALAEHSRRARAGEAAGSNLKEVGFRNATVALHSGGRTSELIVDEATVALEHQSGRSIVTGGAKMQSAKGPWEVTFRTEDSDNGDFVRVTGSIKDLVPAALPVTIAPQLGFLAPLDLPVQGEVAIDLSTSGELRQASLILDLGGGVITPPSLSNTPLTLEHGELKLDYDAEGHRLRVAPSTFKFGDSRVTLEGDLVRDEQTASGPRLWRFGLKGSNGLVAAEEFGVKATPIDMLVASGAIDLQDGRAELKNFTLRAGGSEVIAKGEIVTAGDTPSSRIDATMTPMMLDTLKALWPRAALPGVRTWIGKHVTKGNIKSAVLALASGKFVEPREGQAEGAGRLSMTIDIADLEMVPLPQGLPITAPKAQIRLENNALEVSVPDAALVAGQKQVPLKGARFTVVDMGNETPTGELAFKIQSTIPAMLEAVNRSRVALHSSGPIPGEGMDGKVEGQIKVTMPLVEGDNPPVPKAEGKVRISDIRGKVKAGKLDIQGGTIDVDISPTGALATGDISLNGVIAKVNIQRIFDAPPDQQPPLRITAKLDASDRTQVGLDVNDLVQGETEIEITAAPGSDQPPHGRIDLTNAELVLQDIAWRKTPGRAAFLDFDVVSAPDRTDLKNFRLVGDNVAIEGTVTFDANGDLKEFQYPNFSINVVSRLEVAGKMSADRIWHVTAKGSTFDAKDLFHSLVSLGQPTDAEIKALKPAAGVELTAQVDTVLGHNDVSLRDVKIKLSRRKEQLVMLDVAGTLSGGAQFAAVMKPESGRKLFAESLDAGQALKLTGFYPNMQGGRMRLEVDLERRGAAERSGVLWVDDFRVLGDAIIAEVYSSASSVEPPEGAPKPQNKGKQVEREVFEFTRLKVPFSVGHGQFVLDESYLRGPLLGASLRGKVDYSARRVSLGGTYVPLQGLNAAFCDIPLVGPIVSGLDCQGVFGLTYAIEGPMSRPQVIVNPLSMFTPGILRGIMEMTATNPSVQPREEAPRTPVEQRVRASSSEPDGGAAAKPGAGQIDGWSSIETKPAGASDPKSPGKAGPKKAAQKKKPAKATAAPAAPVQ